VGGVKVSIAKRHQLQREDLFLVKTDVFGASRVSSTFIGITFFVKSNAAISEILP